MASGNDEIDNFIKKFQFKATEYEKVIEWIPFDKLINLQEINEESDLVFFGPTNNKCRQEGFGKVYSSIWLDGK
ncbi:hypothetical protein C2G38_2212131 [Gigaspora rosea]|uniref:Uncharacterized protein n=1 Tax=Gigaspora rosea TaxID=44941 RepID=A0A397UGA1_9GLOM|nr:hypothetical protein C2G38_2212131 [Gigaspora rosea]